MTVEKLSKTFSRLVREAFEEDEFDEIVRRNREHRAAGPCDFCATHAFCDANDIMAAAFKEVFGSEFDCASVEATALFNDAWAMSKDSDFAEPPADDFTPEQRGALLRLIAKPDSYLETLLSSLEKSAGGVFIASGVAFYTNELAEFLHEHLDELHIRAAEKRESDRVER